jgi:DsbC/DsbD-like thiol-disulfide interchange protein
MSFMISRRVSLLSMFAAAAFPATGRAGASESAWSEASHSAMRLIGGGPAGAELGAPMQAAIEIRMAPGFKTYWRDPGDSGVPPVFDWTGSKNLDRVQILWPAPTRFEDGSGFSNGYIGALVLPVKVYAGDTARPVALQVKLDYAVCEKMCIPAQGSAQLILPANAGSHAGRIEAARMRVPSLAAPGEMVNQLAIADVAFQGGAKPTLMLTASTRLNETATDIFVEGPKGSFFGRPLVRQRSVAAHKGESYAHLQIDIPVEEMAKDLDRWPLLVTLATSRGAIETQITLDAPQAAR